MPLDPPPARVPLAPSANTRRRSGLASPQRLFSAALAVSLLMHLVVLPTPWMMALFNRLLPLPNVRLAEFDGEVVIPTELALEEPSQTARPSPEAPTQQHASADEAEATPNGSDAQNKTIRPLEITDAAAKPLKDASAENNGHDHAIDKNADAHAEAATPVVDADAGDAHPHDASPPSASGVLWNAGGGPRAASSSSSIPGKLDDGPATVDGGTGKSRHRAEVRDPIGLAGKAGAIAAKDPGFSMLLFMENIRSHPGAVELGLSLSNLPIWNHFFYGDELNPTRDVDGILITGPSPTNTAKLLVVVKMHLPEAKVHAAVDHVLAQSRPPGVWVSSSPPTAKMHLGRSEHYVIQKGGGMVMLVPESALAQAQKIDVDLPHVRSEALALFLKAPSRMLIGLPFAIPSSIQWVRIGLTLRPDGSGDTAIDMLDTDSTTATESAATLTQGVEAATTRTVPFLGTVRLMAPISFRNDESHIRASVHLNGAELRELARLIGSSVATMGTQ